MIVSLADATEPVVVVIVHIVGVGPRASATACQDRIVVGRRRRPTIKQLHFYL